MFSMVLGLLDQLQILSQLYLIELWELLTALGLLGLWHLIHLRLVTGFGLLVFFTNLSLMGFQIYLILSYISYYIYIYINILWIFGLISSFLSNRQLRVVLDGKSSQKYPVNAGIPQGSILGPTLFLLYINGLPDDVICDIVIYAVDTTLYFKCD